MRKQLMIETSLLKNAQQGQQCNAFFFGVPDALLVQPLTNIRDGLGGLFTNAKDPELRIPTTLFSEKINSKVMSDLVAHTNSLDALLRSGVTVTIFHVDLPQHASMPSETTSKHNLEERKKRYPNLQLIAISEETWSLHTKKNLPKAVYKSVNPRNQEATYHAFDANHPTFPSSEASYAVYLTVIALLSQYQPQHFQHKL